MTPASPPIEVSDDLIQIDAHIIAEAFGLDAAAIHGLMKDRKITSMSERGQDEDAGRFRVTFWYEDRALRLIFDDAGTLLSRSRFAAPRRPLPR